MGASLCGACPGLRPRRCKLRARRRASLRLPPTSGSPRPSRSSLRCASPTPRARSTRFRRAFFRHCSMRASRQRASRRKKNPPPTQTTPARAPAAGPRRRPPGGRTRCRSLRHPAEILSSKTWRMILCRSPTPPPPPQPSSGRGARRCSKRSGVPRRGLPTRRCGRMTRRTLLSRAARACWQAAECLRARASCQRGLGQWEVRGRTASSSATTRRSRPPAATPRQGRPPPHRRQPAGSRMR
mmetsp:Transcript_13475/g.26607  ORF Transcript_13475/g.26607 Transcript_13475/m.26607 type:complete len:241 (+) Transcript_13475:716-1438(+)